MGADQIVGQLLCPAQPRRRLITYVHRQPDALDQVRGALEILGGQGMADGVGRQIVLLVPFTRSPMELGHPSGLCLLQVRPENFGEEVVIAVPPALIVERDDEEVASLQRFQHRFAVCAAR